ncbi:flagellar export protein FliJ [Romboutsia maritimum]|uniref:flagellar export protein FliJ n=1 Tax=Romboutsia maritimum TaxID=2020948 RepID=UPI001FB10F36|nr:flagellar export protein FliJ [Romboutsia maritimum]
MKKFKFRLDKVLDIKIKNEEESKLKYSQAQNRKKIVEGKLENLKSDYNKYFDISEVDDIVTQKITLAYLSSLSHSIKSTTIEVEKEAVKVESAKIEFIDKQIERKSLEKIKEDKLKKLLKEEERKEQITNDEFALYAYMRNRPEFV